VALALLVTGTGAAVAAAWPQLVEHAAASGVAQLPATLFADLSAIALLAVAAVAFSTRVPEPAIRGFAPWLAISATLAVVARTDVLLAVTHSSSWVGLADMLGTASAVALGVGAALQLESARHSERELAIKRERQRLARELHDHVAQELAFIVGQSHELARLLPEHSALADIGAAAKMALDGSRSTIYGLQAPAAHTLGRALEARAHELARRAGVELCLEIEDDVVSSAEVQHAVLSIVAEAISNAVRHAGATKLSIWLGRAGQNMVVRISDNGCGFEPAWAEPTRDGGFGLWSMRERVEALGGQLELTSAPGDGTTIELALA
jgi:signal transduction histidine kinase